MSFKALWTLVLFWAEDEPWASKRTWRTGSIREAPVKRLLLTAVCGSQQHSVSILSSVTSSYHFEISQSECSVTDIGTDHRSGIFLPGETFAYNTGSATEDWGQRNSQFSYRNSQLSQFFFKWSWVIKKKKLWIEMSRWFYYSPQSRKQSIQS